MNHNRQRTISYLRAFWLSNPPPAHTLQDVVTASVQKLSQPDSTILSFMNGSATIHDWRTRSEALFLYLVAWVDGQDAAVTSPGGQLLEFQPARPGREYVTRAGMFMIKGNHCLLIPDINLRVPSMRRYLNALIEHADVQANFTHDIYEFDLLPVENAAKVQEIIRDGGVKKVDLNIGKFRGSSGILGHADSIMGSISNNVRRMLQAGSGLNEVASLADLGVKLTISVGRRRDELKHEMLTRVVRSVADEGDDDCMIFETKARMRVRHGDLVLREPVELEVSGNTVVYTHAWNQMYRYFRELHRTGLLET